MDTNETMIAVDVSSTPAQSPEQSPAHDESILERLSLSAQEGDIDKFYRVLGEDPHILDSFDDLSFCQTPMHVAAHHGHIGFSMEMLNLKPAFSRKLNDSGFSPIHLALNNNHPLVARAFIGMDRDLVGIKGREMITPLHHLARNGDADLLSEFLFACPSSIEGQTIRFETAVHLAVKHDNLVAFKVLLGWLQRVNKEYILNWKDVDGNTVLHLATSRNQTEVVKLLHKIVNVNAKNLGGQTAKNVFISNRDSLDPKIGRILRAARAREGHKLTGTSLASYLCRSLSLMEKHNKALQLYNICGNNGNGSCHTFDLRNVMLVVAILIATTTYQATLTPPGGYWQESTFPNSNTTENLDGYHTAGKMIISPYAALFFYGLNGIAFFSSMWVILMLIIGLPMWKTIYGAIIALGTASYVPFGCTFAEGFGSDYISLVVGFGYPISALMIALVSCIAFVRNKRRRQRVDFATAYFSSPTW